MVHTTPRDGASAPFVYFVSNGHLDDLDTHGDLLDVFDVVRLMRNAAWKEPVPFRERLEAGGATDPIAAVAILMRPFFGQNAGRVVTFDSTDATARLVFADRSTLEVPRHWSGSITEVAITEGAASTLMTPVSRWQPSKRRACSLRPPRRHAPRSATSR